MTPKIFPILYSIAALLLAASAIAAMWTETAHFTVAGGMAMAAISTALLALVARACAYFFFYN